MSRPFRAGYGETVITPGLGAELTGFGFYLRRRAEEVLDDLKVRVLSLSEASGRLLLISCDLIGLSVDFSDRVRRRLARRQGIPLDNILLASTHTHSGPVTQRLLGLGRMDSGFLGHLQEAIEEAVRRARADEEEAHFGFHSEAIEPIGFNRRQRNFGEIDPWLKTALFQRAKGKVFLLNYACHPVTLGPSRAISADWPGATLTEIEKRGNRGLVVQGFCGDIDPVCYLNRRLGGTKDDIALMGTILASRAIKAVRFISEVAEPLLAAREKRIRLPLRVFPGDQWNREIEAALRRTRDFPGARRAVEAWARRMRKHHAAYRRSPWIDNVPVQGLSIGSLRILALPGEAFCGLGLRLRRRWPALLTVGYANGNIGYLPTRQAFADSEDYACYVAPLFYAGFPFSPDVESTLLEASREVLSSLP